MSATCADISTNGLLSQNFTGGGADSEYSCAFATNYTSLATKCCASSGIHPLGDPCYSWCDLPASMNYAFDTDNPDYFQYFKGCLNSTGLSGGPLWCHAVPHIVVNPTPTTTSTRTATPASVIQASYCATANPQNDIAVNDPAPACGILANQTNTEALQYCCAPAAVKWTVEHCWEYCPLPRGNNFRGVGNLTYDQTLGSFKTCLQQQSSNAATAFDGIFCRVNGSEIDLQRTTFQTTQYLTGGGTRLSGDHLLQAVTGITVLIATILFT